MYINVVHFHFISEINYLPINDINNSLFTSLCFADGTTVFYSSADITDLHQTMNIAS